jgi:SAM-dependent methyltransferase
MKEIDYQKAALRGEPSYVWRSGQERRLQMILREAAIHAKGSVLDLGRAKIASKLNLSITCSAGENLPFASHSFDLILSHEVLEHVEDDQANLKEIARTLRVPNPETKSPGGRLILFLPNRGYPFETHGVYWRRKYHFGNIPLVNYLPKALRDRFAPHVRSYSIRDLFQLLDGLPFRVIYRTIIFGAYDNIIYRWPTIGRILRTILQALERTPLRFFGLSHFWVLERISQDE